MTCVVECISGNVERDLDMYKMFNKNAEYLRGVSDAGLDSQECMV